MNRKTPCNNTELATERPPSADEDEITPVPTAHPATITVMSDRVPVGSSSGSNATAAGTHTKTWKYRIKFENGIKKKVHVRELSEPKPKAAASHFGGYHCVHLYAPATMHHFFKAAKRPPKES